MFPYSLIRAPPLGGSSEPLENTRALQGSVDEISDQLGTYSTPSSGHSLLSVLWSEINRSMQRGIALQQEFSVFLPAVRSLESEGKTFSKHHISQALQNCSECYNKTLKKYYRLATSTAGARCLEGFVCVILRGFAQAPNVSEECLVAEIKYLIKYLPAVGEAEAEGEGFNLVQTFLVQVANLVKDKLNNSRSSLPGYDRLLQLERELKAAQSRYTDQVRTYLEHTCLKENLPLEMIIEGQLSGMAKPDTPNCDLAWAHMLAIGRRSVQDLEAKLSEAWDSLAKSRDWQDVSDRKWRVTLLRINAVRRIIRYDIAPILSVFDHIHSRVRADCKLGLSCLQGSESQKPELKGVVTAKFKESYVLYTLLILLLKGYVSGVVLDSRSIGLAHRVTGWERNVQSDLVATRESH